MKTEDRDRFLQWISRHCTNEDLTEIRSLVNAEVARRDSAILVHLMPGDRIRFQLPANELQKGWTYGTVMEIHRRMAKVRDVNGNLYSVNARRIIETVPEEHYLAAVMQLAAPPGQSVMQARPSPREPIAPVTIHQNPAFSQVEPQSDEPITPDELHVRDI